MTTSVSDDDPSHGARTEARGGLAAYLTAYTVTMVGDRFAEIALPIAVLAATGDPAAAGAVAASVQVPALLLALALGDWTDRRSRRAMLVLADAVRAAGFGAFALLAAGPVTQLVPYLVVGTLVGCGNVLFGVAGQAVLPQLVRGTSLGRANASLEVGDAATTVVGPTVAGVAIARTSAAWGLAVNAVSYLISGTVLRLFLPPLRPSSALSVARKTGWSPRRLVDPVRLIIRDRLQLSVQLALMVLSAHGAALVLAVVVFGREELALTVGQIGILLSAGGVGGLATGLLVARFGAIAHRVRTVGLALLLGGAAAGALALAPSFSAAVLANGALDAFVTVGFVATATIRQSRTPNQVLGRVSAASAIANNLARVIGASGVGVLLAVFGGRIALAVDAALLAVAGVVVSAYATGSVPVRSAGDRPSGHPEGDQTQPGHQRQDADADQEAGTEQ